MFDKLLLVFLLLFNSSILFSQSKGEDSSPNQTTDSVFIFTPIRPLLGDTIVVRSDIVNFLELTLSDNGYSIGYYATKELNSLFSLTGSIFFSGARNTDEIEFFDPFTGQFFIPGKINRLFMLPISIGLRTYLFPSELSKEFKPFLQANIGTNVILSNPYELGFFEAWEEANIYYRPVMSVGVGASFSNRIRPLEMSLRYQYSPFGGEGLESIIRNPIKNFGGLYISLGIAL